MHILNFNHCPGLTALRSFAVHALAAFFLIGWQTAALAQTTRTWNGGGADNNWGTAANWGGTAPVAGNTLAFSGTTQTSTNNNITADTSFAGINFTNTTAGQAFTLAGNRITLGGNIVTSTLTGGVSSATILDTISLDMVLSNNRTIQTAGSSTNGNHNLTISGVISESGGSFGLLKQGGSGGVLTLSALNTFSGTVTLVSGTISFNTIADAGTASALGKGGTILTGSSAGSTGTLLYTGSGSSTNRQIQIGTGTGVGSSVGVMIQNDGSGALTFTSSTFNPTYTSVVVGAKTLTLQGSNTGSNTIQGVIQDNNVATGATIAVTKDGAGLWVLSGANTFTGQVRIDQGTLSVNSLADAGTVSALGTGTGNSVINIGSGTSGGTLIYTGASTSSTNRQVQIGRSATNTGGATIQNDGAGALIFTNSLFNALDATITNASAARTLTLQGANAGANEIMGIIGNNVGSATGVVSVTKSGAGAWLLSGVNTFSGQVRIDNGTLSVSSIADSGTASALGTGATNALINIGAGSNTGTLIYTGSANASTNRQVQIGRSNTSSGGATIQNDGVGTLTFSNAVFNVSDTTVNNVSADRVLTLQGSNTGGNEIRGVISDNIGSATGVLALVKAGSGTWTLSGANTFSDGLTLSAGTLNINNAGSGGASSALGTGTLTISGGTIDNTTASALTLSTGNAIAFNGSFTFGGTQSLNFGSGVVTIGAASRTLTLNGGSVLTLGQLQWSSASDRTLTVGQGTGSGARLVLGGFQLSILSSATSAITRTITGGANVEINAAIVNGNSFANNFTYSGTGVLTLSAANSYTGITTAAGGLIMLSSATALPGGTSGTAAGTSYLNFNNGGIIGLTAASGDFTRAIDSGSTALLTGNLVRWGATGGESGGFAAFGGDRIVNFGGLGAQVTWSSGNGVLGSGLILGYGTSDSTITVVNPIAFNSSTRTITVNDGTPLVDAILSGALSGTSSALIKNGTGTLALTAANTLGSALTTGTTFITISAGTLQLGNGGATGSLTSSGSGDIQDDSILAIKNTGTVTLQYVIKGVGIVNQTGTGITILSGANTYAGGTNVTSGILTFLNASAMPAIGSVTVASGATLGLGVAASGSFFTAADLDSLFAGTLAGVTSSATSFVGIDTSAGDFLYTSSVAATTRGLTKLGLNVLTLSGANAYSGATTILAGTLQLGSGGATGSLDATAAIINNATLAFNRSDTALTISAVISGSGAVTQLGSGTTILTAANTYTGATTISSGILQLGSGGSSGSIDSTSSIVDNGTLVFNRSDASLVISAVISGSGAVSQIGSGTTILAATNTYTGATTINAGSTLQLGSGAGGGSTGNVSSSSSVLNNGTLVFNRTGAPVFGVVISGSGAVKFTGTGTVVLTATNTYTGVTTISSGTLQLGSGTGGGSTGNISNSSSVVNNSVLTFNRSNSPLISTPISGTGAVNVIGNGTIILTDSNSYTGLTTISAGTLQVGNGGTVGEITGTSGIVDNSALAINRSNATSITAPISGTGVVNQIGNGATTFTSANTYTGGTSVTHGSLLVTNTTGSATGSGSVTTSAGTVLGGTGTIAPAAFADVTIAGSVTPGIVGVSNGVGTLTFTPVDGDVILQTSSSIILELSGNHTNDKVVFHASGSGVIDFSAMADGGITVVFTGGYTPSVSDSFDLLDWSAVSGSGITGLSDALLSLSTAGFDSSMTWDTSQFASTGVISIISSAPEPSRILFIACGLTPILLRRRRKQPSRSAR